jgi:hypothetical protein
MPRETADAPRARQRHKARGSTPQVRAHVGWRGPICSRCCRQTHQERFRWLTKIGDAELRRTQDYLKTMAFMGRAAPFREHRPIAGNARRFCCAVFAERYAEVPYRKPRAATVLNGESPCKSTSVR